MSECNFEDGNIRIRYQDLGKDALVVGVQNVLLALPKKMEWVGDILMLVEDAFISKAWTHIPEVCD